MGTFKKFETTKLEKQKEILLINQKLQKVEAGVICFTFRDKDTQQYISFIPSLDVSGYGATRKKAHDMLKQSVDDLNEFLIHLPVHKLASELKKLGWTRSKIKTKEYSKAYVDVNGQLKGFNAVEDSIEKEVFTLA